MSLSLRNHRIIIASLFLPTTAVLGDSTPATPVHFGNELKIPASAFKVKPSSDVHSRRGSISTPLKSIVEDLKDKAYLSRNATPAVLSPSIETANPFAIQNLGTALTQASSPSARRPQPTHPEHQQAGSRIQRKNSRSSSRRRSEATELSGLSKLTSTNAGVNASPSQQGTGWHLESNPHCNGGLKNAVDSVYYKLKRKLWVGTLGTKTDQMPQDLRTDIDKRMLTQCASLPVWIPDAEFESCYDEFCHQVLWPCLHYAIPDAPKTKLFYESASFKQYVAVNQRFADAIVANYQEGDMIWVNDYHLLLLPLLLRSSSLLPSHVPIGFFLHVAFPSSEIFRCLSVRESLLRGLLAADLIGFQTASYARHFRQTVSRILACEALPKGVILDAGNNGGQRFVDVGVFPMGIDVGALREKRQEPEVTEWVQVLKQRYAGMKIVVGRDKLDDVQGVRHKIRAFEAFLDKFPEFQQKVVLIQVALQTTEINELAGGVADAVSHLNSRFSTLTYQPVVFLHTQDLTFSQYLALLTVADAFLVTSLREGMALRTHEFVECQEERHRPLILSEFTGSYSYSGFRSCIAINPWDTRGTASAIHQALTMSDDEALSRWEDLHNHVVTQTAQAFVTSFLMRCLRANTEHLQPDINSVMLIDIARVLPRYKHSPKRLLLVDFEGTIWIRDVSRPGIPFNPPADVLDLLAKLAEDKKNEVWLLSGLPVKDMLDKVAERLPKIGIVAENGCFIKPRPTRNASSPQWINMVANLNLTWMSTCLEILSYFTERTPGSYVEAREASVVWRFWTGPTDNSSDRQWARRQAAEAQNHVFDSLGERFGLRIIPGANSFLVLPNNISRSAALSAILHPGGPTHSPLIGRAAWMSESLSMADTESVGGDVAFVLAISGDEKLLRSLNEFDEAETCSTSGKGTDARWKVDSNGVKTILSQLASIAS